jgi:tetratricopeptide (TPR) repeat protein
VDSDNRVDGNVRGNVVQAGSIEHVYFGAPEQAGPANGLPRKPPVFLNRESELRAFTELVDAAAAAEEQLAFAITGFGGVGKTALAVHWAHRVRPQFRDGVVFAELGGSAENGPVPVGTLLAGLLRQLGQTDIPKSDEERQAAYRARTADSELLVVLDDAATMAQVVAALPASERSAVLVTCRSALAGFAMHDIALHRLEPLASGVAAELVARVVGDKLRPEDERELASLVAMCGGLPLALRVAAVQLRDHYWGAADRFVAQLGAERDRLKSFHVDEDRLVDAVFDAGYRHLDADSARAYRLLALWDGPDFDVEAAAALLARDTDATRSALRELVRANLMSGADRYAFHPLIRLHGRDRAEQAETVDERRAALGRMTRHYRDYLIGRDKALSTRPRACDALYDEIPVVHQGDPASALADLERERENLLAAVLTAQKWGFHDHSWQLCVALFPFYFQRSHFEDWVTTHNAGLDAAAGQPRASIQLHNQLGSAYFELDENAKALEHYQRSLELAIEADDPLGQQSAWEWIGFIHERRANYGRALQCFDTGRALIERWPADKQPRALALYAMNSGRVLVAAGRVAEAVPALDEAMAYFAQAGDAVNVAKTAGSLGEAHRAGGRPADAIGPLEQALAVLTELGSLAWQASVHESLAATHELLGHDEQAERHRAEQARLDEEITARRRGAQRP